MRISAKNSPNLTAEFQNLVVERLKWSASFCCCSRRKAFNGAEEIAPEEGEREGKKAEWHETNRASKIKDKRGKDLQEKGAKSSFCMNVYANKSWK